MPDKSKLMPNEAKALPHESKLMSRCRYGHTHFAFLSISTLPSRAQVQCLSEHTHFAFLSIRLQPYCALLLMFLSVVSVCFYRSML